MPAPFDPDLASKLLSKAGVKVTCTWINGITQSPSPWRSNLEPHLVQYIKASDILIRWTRPFDSQFFQTTLSSPPGLHCRFTVPFIPRVTLFFPPFFRFFPPFLLFSEFFSLEKSPANWPPSVWTTLWWCLQVSPSELAARASPTAPRYRNISWLYRNRFLQPPWAKPEMSAES